MRVLNPAVAVATLALLVAACGGSSGAKTSASPSPSSPASESLAARPQSVVLTSDPKYVVARWRIGAKPCGVVSDGTAMWVSTFGDSTLVRIDPTSNTVTDTVPTGTSPCGLAFGDHSIWTSEYGSGTVTRVDTSTRKVVATIKAGEQLYDTAFGDGAVWTTSFATNELVRIDPATNTVSARIAMDGPQGVAALDGTVWVGAAHGVVRVNPQTNKIVSTIDVGASGATWAAIGPHQLVFTTPGDTAGQVIDLLNARVAHTTTLGSKPVDGDILGNVAWIPNRSPDPELWKLALDGSAATHYSVPLIDPFVLAGGFGDLWLPDFGSNDVIRVKISAL